MPTTSKTGIRCLYAVTIVLILLPIGSLASGGDRQTAYKRCVSTCSSGSACVQGTISNSEAAAQGPIVCSPACNGGRVDAWAVGVLWGCQDDCRYLCMWAVEEARRHDTEKYRPLKYHGKWPFVRVFGFQEIVSSVASAANLLAHVAGYRALMQALNVTSQDRRTYPYSHLWALHCTSSCAAWVASIVFHARDTPLTEASDYGAANTVLATGLWASLYRCLGCRVGRLSMLPIASGLTYHLWRMNVVKFDYGLNMQLCVSLGLLQSLLWASWGWRTQHEGRVKLWAFMGLVNLAMLLEVLDFEPIHGLLDAHACWHLATVPLTSLWYSFLIVDAKAAAQTKTGNKRSVHTTPHGSNPELAPGKHE